MDNDIYTGSVADMVADTLDEIRSGQVTWGQIFGWGVLLTSLFFGGLYGWTYLI